MAMMRRLGMSGLCAALTLLCACDRSRDSSTPYNLTLGDKPTGAPLGLPVVDVGILVDQTTYQAGSGGSAAAAVSGDAQEQVRAFVDKFVENIEKGEFGAVLDSFNSEHVAALRAVKQPTDIESVLIELHDTISGSDGLLKALAAKFGEDQANQIQAMVSGIKSGLSVEVRDAQNALVKVALPIPGAAASSGVPLVLENNSWKIQLPKAITEEEAAQIVASLQMVKTKIAELTQAVQEGKVSSPAQLQGMFLQMMTGGAAPPPGAPEGENGGQGNQPPPGGQGKQGGQGSPGDKVDFVRDVQPIFAAACYQCHSASRSRGQFRLDSKAAAMKGGESGPAIVPGDSEKSLLIQLITNADEQKRMPRNHDPLSEEQVQILRKWIDQGADWPDTASGENGQAPNTGEEKEGSFKDPRRRPGHKPEDEEKPGLNP